MSLQIVAGSSGAGKSHTVYEELIQASMEHPEQTFLVIVPEQFTMQTQKDLVQMHPRKGLLNMDVLSFNRLAWRVFEEVGGGREPILDDLGKSLVLQRVISSAKKELSVLGGTLGRTGSAEQMKSLISELLQYRVKPEDLEEWVGRLPANGELLTHKLKDVRCIYQKFMEYLENRYLTTEEVPERLCTVIGKSTFVRNSVVVLDGFTGFTPVQHKVLEELLRLAASVTVIVTADRRTDLTRPGSPQHLFHMSTVMVRKLYDLASEVQCEILPERRIDGSRIGRFCCNPPLAFLEQNLFRYRHSVMTEQQDRVRIVHAPDPRREAAYIVSEITRLIREKGLRYRDFAIVTGDLEQYGRELAGQLEQSGMPYFLDQKKNILANPLAECLRAAVDMVVSGFAYESVFRFLKCGLTDFTPEETDRLENYCLAVGIRGWKQYQERWIRLPKRMEPGEIEPLNELRERFTAQIGAFTEGMRTRGATLRQKVETIYRLMESLDLQQKMADLEKQFEETGDLIRAREYAQMYPMVIDLLERLVEILGEEKTGMTAFQELLDAGLTEMRVGLIPPGEDQIMIGDIERTRLKRIRVLFFAGIHEGVIPRASGSDGILSETDRRTLEKQKIELAPDSRKKMYQQRFYLYLSMTKPSDALYLSYSDMGSDGKGLMPSYLIGVIRNLFPAIVPVRTEEAGILHRLETSGGVREVMLEALRKDAKQAGKEAKQEGKEAEQAGEALCEDLFRLAAEGRLKAFNMDADFAGAILDAAKTRCPSEGLRPETARALYGSSLVNSATRIERFAACAFSHFAQYGLALREREEYDFTPADMGTVMHAALERFSGKLEKRKLNWRELTKEQRHAVVDESVDEIVHDYGNTILHSTDRNTYMIHRIRRILYRTVWALQEQLIRSAFSPAGAEAAFRSDELDALQIRLSEKDKIRLQGRIDRIDVCDTDSTRYVRIIDYKTGQTKLQADYLYYGLQLQLPLYLNAALEQMERTSGGRPAEPAGIYYYNIKDPIIEETSGKNRAEAAGHDTDRAENEADRAKHDAETQKAFLKELKMDGLSRSEDRILELLDRTSAGYGSAEVIPVSRNKDGSLGSVSRVATTQQFETIRAYTTEKIRALGKQMLSGGAQINPYAEGWNSACTWCPYRSVCGFDERIPGYRYRRLRKMDRNEAISAMEKELIDNGSITDQ